MIVEIGASQNQKYHYEASQEIERKQPLRVVILHGMGANVDIVARFRGESQCSLSA
jgi:hypothetical protein